MQAFKQFLLLSCMRLSVLFGEGLKHIVLCIPLIAAVYWGALPFAAASMLFFWCFFARPSVENKNIHHIWWGLKSAPVCILLSWLLIAATSLFPYALLSLVYLLFIAPFIVALNLYVLDAGLRIHRLLYMPIGIARMYFYSLLFAIPVFLGAALLAMVIQFVCGAVFGLGLVASYWFFVVSIAFGAMPLVVSVYSIIYYQQLYKDYRIYYAEI